MCKLIKINEMNLIMRSRVSCKLIYYFSGYLQYGRRSTNGRNTDGDDYVSVNHNV